MTDKTNRRRRSPDDASRAEDTNALKVARVLGGPDVRRYVFENGAGASFVVAVAAEGRTVLSVSNGPHVEQLTRALALIDFENLPAAVEPTDRAALQIFGGGRANPEHAAYYGFGWRPRAGEGGRVWDGPAGTIEPMRRMFEGYGFTVEEAPGATA